MPATSRHGSVNARLPFNRALLVDDQLLFADALTSVLRSAGITTVEQAAEPSEASRRAAQICPDLVLVNADDSGLSVGKAILARHPSTTVVAMSSSGSERHLATMRKIGFRGLLSKSASLSEFLNALSRVGCGTKVFRPRTQVDRDESQSSDERLARLMVAQLTTRELDVLRLLVNGSSSEDIAQALCISTNTVRSHIQSVLYKLQVHSRLAAATFAIRYGIFGGRRKMLSKRSA